MSYKNMLITKKKRPCLSILVLSLILSAAQIVGCNLSIEHQTSVHNYLSKVIQQISTSAWLLIFIIETIALYSFFKMLFCILDRRTISENRIPSVVGFRFVTVGTLGILVGWIPVLLANLPGFFNYDIIGQLIQVMYDDLNTYNTHHSLISTLYMGGIITLGYNIWGELSAGVLLFSCVQMFLCACTFAYSLLFILKKTGSKVVVAISFVFYACFPTIVMFSMSTTKDVVCSLGLLIAMLLLFDMIEDAERFFAKPTRPILLIVVLILASLFRKNIIYAVCLYAFLCLLIINKERIHIAILFAIVIVGFFTTSVALEKGLHAEKSGVAEAYSVPIQQLGYLYNAVGTDAFSNEEWELLSGMVPVNKWKEYNPFISDSIKNYIYRDYFIEHKKEFLTLWIKKGLQYPDIYLKAFCNLTYQAWYPWTSISPGEIYYFDFYGINYPIEKTTHIPAITEFYRKISLEYYYQKVPIVRLLFSNGFMFWVLLISACRGIYKKQKMVWGSVLFTLCVCLTCLAGPVSLIRYYLILFYAFPIHLTLLLYIPFEEKASAGILNSYQ